MSKFLLVNDEFINLDNVLKVVADKANLTIAVVFENPELNTLREYEHIGYFETAYKELLTKLDMLFI